MLENNSSSGLKKVFFTLAFLLVVWIFGNFVYTAVTEPGTGRFIDEKFRGVYDSYISSDKYGYVNEDDYTIITTEYNSLLDFTYVSNEDDAISLELKEYYEDGDRGEIYDIVGEDIDNWNISIHSTRGIVLENTGDVPLQISNVEFMLNTDDNDTIAVSDLSDAAYDLGDNSYYTNYHFFYDEYQHEDIVIYPGEEYPFVYQGEISLGLLQKYGIDYDTYDNSIDSGAFKVEYIAHDKDLKLNNKNKQLIDKEHSAYTYENMVLDYSDNDRHEGIVKGDIVINDNKQDEDCIFYSYYPYIKYYDENYDTKELELVGLSIMDRESIEIDELKSDSIEIEVDTPILVPIILKDYSKLEDLDKIEYKLIEQ